MSNNKGHLSVLWRIVSYERPGHYPKEGKMPLTTAQIRSLTRAFCILVDLPGMPREYCVNFYARHLPEEVIDKVSSNFFQRPTGPDVKGGTLCVRRFGEKCRYRWIVRGRPPGFSTGTAILSVTTAWSDVP